MEKWKCLDSKLVYENRFFKVRQDDVQLPNGQKIKWTYWDSNDSAMVLGMTEDKKLVMIRQYRYMVDEQVIEFPSGQLKENEPPDAAAKREFEEETGYTCSSLINLGVFYETYGQLNRKIYFFFANDIKKSQQRQDEGEDLYENISVELVEFEKAVELALENKLVAMGSALAVLLLKEKIQKKEIIL